MKIKITLLPFIVAEIICIIFYISNFGFLNYLGEVFLSAIIGFILVFSYGFLNFYNKFRILSLKTVFGSMGLVIGGILLILPGILSDFIAVFVIAISLILKLFGYMQEDNFQEDKFNSKVNTNDDDDMIDVEIIDEKR